MSRPPVWKPWHAAPNPAEDGVVLTAKEVAEIEAARAQRRQEMKKRARLARHRAKRAAANGKKAIALNRLKTLNSVSAFRQLDSEKYLVKFGIQLQVGRTAV
jgi:hypothetical protein